MEDRRHVAGAIKDAQVCWARSNGISVDPYGYVNEVEDNLWKPLSPRAREGFENGAGSELSRHMKALHASSALVANFFDYWTERDKGPLLSALEIDAGDVDSLDFEAKFDTGLGRIPPHLDIAIRFSTGAVVAVESKFTEYLTRSRDGKGKFKPAYFESGDLWAERKLPACQVLARELDARHCRFDFLDAGQLLKHALGLATQAVNGFNLYYLYYDCPGKRSEAHKEEVRRFSDRVGDELGFKALTYQEVYARLKASADSDPEYLRYLGERYFPSIP